MAGTPLVIRPGDLVVQDPEDVAVYAFDWGTENLQDGVAIASSTFIATTLKPASADPVVIDGEAIDGQTTVFRVSPGQYGAIYEIANRIVTDENPAQTKERSFRLRIQDK